jgi:uncharacterized protein (TIGR03435 family)
MQLMNVSGLVDFAFKQYPVLPQKFPWVFDTMFDLIGKTPVPSTIAELRLMLRKVLTERFAFKYHIETVEGPVLALVLGSKPHLEEAQGDGEFGVSQTMTSDGKSLLITGRNVTMTDIAHDMSGFGKNPVIDKTGLTGRYDFTMTVEMEFIPPLDVELPPGAQRLSGLSTQARQAAIVKHLGLKLESQRGPIETFIIDHIEKPSEN